MTMDTIARERDGLGLAVDMLDADRLRALADNLETVVRDIGQLRRQRLDRDSERVLAYYILAATHPEQLHAEPVVRATTLDRIMAAIQTWRKGCDPTDSLDLRAHRVILALMTADRDAKERRRQQGGW